MSTPVVIYATKNTIEPRSPPSYNQALIDLKRMETEEREAVFYKCRVVIVKRTGGPGKKGNGEQHVETLFNNRCFIKAPNEHTFKNTEMNIAPRIFATIKVLQKLVAPNDAYTCVHHDELVKLIGI